MYQQLLKKLHKQHLILTANSRLAQYLQKQYFIAQQSRHNTTWVTVPIMPLASWITHFWHQHSNENKQLTNGFYESFIWQDIIAKDPATECLIHVNEAAELAKQAWHILNQWQINIDQCIPFANEETHCFIRWHSQFAKICQQSKFITQSELPLAIHKLVNSKNLATIKEITFVGFDDINPSIHRLIDKLKTVCQINFHKTRSVTAPTQRIEAKDSEQEISMMCYWAKKMLTQHRTTNLLRIGCIVPNLANMRQPITRIFTEVFTPNNIVPNAKPQKKPFNISAGQPLSLYPLINCALSILKLDFNKIDPKNLTQLLQSPHINHTLQDQCLAAELNLKLNALNQTHYSAIEINLELKQLSENYQPATLNQRWNNYCNLQNQTKADLSTTELLTLMQQKLISIGWAQQRKLNSEEYQTLQRWKLLLIELNQLADTISSLNYTQLIKLLNQMAAQTVFQAQSDEQCPIQVLGLLESTGYQFDALWIMGLDAENWPAPVQPNPFIPINLQQQHNMPHASANRELTYARQVQARLLASSDSVILSSAQSKKDKALRPSKLITHFSMIDTKFLNKEISTSYNYQLWQSKKIEKICDTQAPALNTNEVIKGGSQLLQLQAECPFHAFAATRLTAKDPTTKQLGISHSDRGKLTHHILDLVWKEIKTHQKLCQLSQDDLNLLIKQTIKKSLKSSHINTNPYFIEIERERLQQLIMQWIQNEKKRPPFSVSERETKRHIKLNQLHLTIQIDRIDNLINEEKLIIDYKTGKNNSIKGWLDERLSKPQLPLYCCQGTNNVIGLAYAEVRLNQNQFIGFISETQETQTFDKVKSINTKKINWKDQIKKWQQNLNELSQEFCQGNAIVKPIDKACQYCQLQSLCRINEK